MSHLKQLLAVGESFFGVRSEPSPYELRKKHRLPVFGPAQEVAETIPVLNDAAATEPVIAPQKELDFAARTAARIKISPERSRIEKEPEERRMFLHRPKSSSSRKTMTQEEMSLDQVKVMRNDLLDADLELTPRKAARSGELDVNPFAPRPIAALGRPAHEKQGWAARLARLIGLTRRGRP